MVAADIERENRRLKAVIKILARGMLDLLKLYETESAELDKIHLALESYVKE